MILGLVDLFKHRSSMGTGQVVGWTLFIILVPIVGLFSYLFWRISRSDAMQDAIDYNAGKGGSSRPLPPRGN
jgi:high-affinity Fe2+/Pb2+ permease